MTWRRTGLVAGAAAVLVLLATSGLTVELRTVALVGVAGLLVVGQRFREPGTTALGLLGLVTAVAAGPAASAAAPGLLGWAVPTWTVTMAAVAGLGPAWPRPRDIRARVRVHGAAIGSCVAAVPLVVLATAGGRPGPGWAVGSGLVLLAGLFVAARAGTTDNAVNASHPGDADGLSEVEVTDEA